MLVYSEEQSSTFLIAYIYESIKLPYRVFDALFFCINRILLLFFWTYYYWIADNSLIAYFPRAPPVCLIKKFKQIRRNCFMDEKFNPRNKDIIKFIVDEKFLIECDFKNGKYTWTNLKETESHTATLNTIEISRELAYEYYLSKLQEYKYNHKVRAYHDEYADIEIKIKINELPNSLSAEEEFIKNEDIKNLLEAEKILTKTQRNRIEKHIIYKIPVTEMALVEQTGKNKIFKSIRLGLDKVKKYLKKFEK